MMHQSDSKSMSRVDAAFERPTEQRNRQSTTEPSSLATKLYTRLPRELRNRIYAFCIQSSLDNDVIVRRSPIGSLHNFTPLVRETIGPHMYQWVEDPIIVYASVEHVGPNIAREMLDAYYWTRIFKFSHHELCLLDSFLQSDGFGLGLKPADFVRRLQLQVQPLTSAMLRVPERRKEEEDICCRALKSLAGVQLRRAEVTIQIDLAQGSMNDEDYETSSIAANELLAKILGIVNHLREGGLRIHMACTRVWNDEQPTSSPSEKTTNKKLNNVRLVNLVTQRNRMMEEAFGIAVQTML